MGISLHRGVHIVSTPPSNPARTISVVWFHPHLLGWLGVVFSHQWVSWRGSPYLASSCVIAGTDPGMTWMDASGTVSYDRSGWFMYVMLAVLSLRLAEPFVVLITTWARILSSILYWCWCWAISRYTGPVQNGKLQNPSHQGYSVGLQLQGMLHYVRDLQTTAKVVVGFLNSWSTPELEFVHWELMIIWKFSGGIGAGL